MFNFLLVTGTLSDAKTMPRSRRINALFTRRLDRAGYTSLTFGTRLGTRYESNRFERTHRDRHRRRARIGLAIARRLVASGAQVQIWDRDETHLNDAIAGLAGMKGKATGAVVDVADPAAVERGAKDAIDALGKIDILVNNAGISGLNAPTIDYPIDEWERVLRVNLTSQFLCCRAIAPHMVKQKYGRIVNVASVAGKEGNPNAVAYSASKAGVISLTKSLGKELAHDGVLVNCVTPAAARTALFDQMTQAHIDFMLSKIPIGRFVTVDEIAALVAWLASEDCAFSTGAVFDISGGRATY